MGRGERVMDGAGDVVICRSVTPGDQVAVRKLFRINLLLFSATCHSDLLSSLSPFDHLPLLLLLGWKRRFIGDALRGILGDGKVVGMRGSDRNLVEGIRYFFRKNFMCLMSCYFLLPLPGIYLVEEFNGFFLYSRI